MKSTQLRDANKEPKIDILGPGRMTVMYPTLHPDTQRAYEQAGSPLYQLELKDLPRFSDRALKILKVIVASEHTPILIRGVGTHSAALSLVAQLVAAGCTDEEITKNVRALLPVAYAGNTMDELAAMIQGAREKGFGEAGHLPLDDYIATLVEKSFGQVVYTIRDNFMRYEKGYWHNIHESEIDRLAKEFLSGIISPKRQVHPILHNVRACLALNTYRPNFGQKSGLICLRNGTLDVMTGKLLPHAPEHELRYGLDFDYDPDAVCPIYEEHIHGTLMGDEKAIALFDEFCGHTLVSDMRLQKSLYLIGEGGGGKSKLLGTLEIIHDPAAISATPLHKLDEERYLTDVVGKLVNISYDVQSKQKVFGQVFTQITGGDPVPIRRLYEEVEGKVTPTTRFMGSMNPEKPKFIAARDALERRLIFLQCGPKVVDPDPNRGEKLKAERAGILVRWVRALRRLYARGHFDIPETSIEEVREYLHTQEPFDLFVTERLEKDPNGRLPVVEVMREFNVWADDMGEARLTLIAVGMKLSAAGFARGSKHPTEASEDKHQRTVRAQFSSRKPRTRREF